MSAGWLERVTLLGNVDNFPNENISMQQQRAGADKKQTALVLYQMIAQHSFRANFRKMSSVYGMIFE